MTLVYVTDIERSNTFYQHLGFLPSVKSRSRQWAELALGEAVLGLHRTDSYAQTPGNLELCLIASEPLEHILERLQSAGISVSRFITDEGFGRSLELKDPDGLPIVVLEHDLELYT